MSADLFSVERAGNCVLSVARLSPSLLPLVFPHRLSVYPLVRSTMPLVSDWINDQEIIWRMQTAEAPDM